MKTQLGELVVFRFPFGNPKISNHGQPTPQQKRKFIPEGNRLPIENVQTSVPPFSLLHFPKNNPLPNSKNLAVIHGCPPSVVGGRGLWNSTTPVVWKSGIPKGKQCSIRKSLDSKCWKMNAWDFFLNLFQRLVSQGLPDSHWDHPGHDQSNLTSFFYIFHPDPRKQNFLQKTLLKISTDSYLTVFSLTRDQLRLPTMRPTFNIPGWFAIPTWQVAGEEIEFV